MLLEYKDLIEGNPVSIATTDGRTPNIAVVADVVVVSDNQILISHNEMVKTIENIKVNNAVCLTSFNKDWEGVRIYGVADYYIDGRWFEKVNKFFKNDNNTPKGAILITAQSIQEIS